MAPTLSDILTDPALQIAVPVVAIGFMVLEYLMSRLAHHDHETHDLPESAASLGIGLGQNAVRALEAGIVAIPFVFFYQHRLFDFDQTRWLSLAGLFIGTEFLYYWHHRCAHRIRWMWATHCVHHSATKLNFTAAIRLGWTGTISGSFLFFLPLAFIGFQPAAIIAMLGVNLLYQFFIHTELAPKLGPLEWILNTPAHHRVHHASNQSCLDRNYGGVLIIFDRLFGTFAEAPKDEPLRYGLVGVATTLNPLRITFGEWVSMALDFAKAKSWSDRWRILFAPPGAVKKHKSAVASSAPSPSSTNLLNPGE